MSARVEISDEEAAGLYEQIKSGVSSRDAALWFQQKTARSISHPTILKLTREMRAEEEEVNRLFEEPADGRSPGNDWEQLAEAIRAMRRLRVRAVSQRTGSVENTRMALRVLSLEISALRFKINLKAKMAAAEDDLLPADTTFPAGEILSAPAGAVAPESVETKGDPDFSKDLSTDPSKGLSGDPGQALVVPAGPIGEGRAVLEKQGRNEQCGCGSGLKFKRCCGGLMAPPRVAPGLQAESLARAG